MTLQEFENDYGPAMAFDIFNENAEQKAKKVRTEQIEIAGGIYAYLTNLFGGSIPDKFSISAFKVNGNSYKVGKNYTFGAAQAAPIAAPTAQSAQTLAGPILPTYTPPAPTKSLNEEWYIKDKIAKLEKDVEKYEAEAKRYKEKYEDLKEDAWKSDRQVQVLSEKVNEKSIVKEIFDSVAKQPEVLAGIVGAFSPNRPGLQGAQEQLSPTKQQVVDFVKSLDDTSAEGFSQLVIKITTDENFSADMRNLINKYN